MQKLVILCSFLVLLFSTSSATVFLFGVDVKCSIDKDFWFIMSHWEYDREWTSRGDDQTTERIKMHARKHIFLYQQGYQSIEMGREFEPYGWFYHNCTDDGNVRKYERPLEPIDKSHGLVYVEYTAHLTNAGEDTGSFAEIEIFL